MGYEMKLFVVVKSVSVLDCIDANKNRNNKPKFFGNNIASIDLGKIDDALHKFNNYPESDCYIYLDGDGDNECIKDAYDNPLREIPLDDAISILREGIALSNGYGRYIMALNLLESIKIANMDKGNIVILSYGH